MFHAEILQANEVASLQTNFHVRKYDDMMKVDETMLPFAQKSDLGDGILGIHATSCCMVALSTLPGWPQILPDFQVFLAGNRWSNALLRRALNR